MWAVKSTPEQRDDATFKLLGDIDDAARANGIDPDKRKKLFASARGKVRSKYYTMLFEAVEAEDWGEANRVADILVGLGATEENVAGAAKSREAHPATAQDAAGLMPIESEGVGYEEFAR